MPQSVFFFLLRVYFACANFIPQSDIWGYEDDLISHPFEEIGNSNPIVANDFGDFPDNDLDLWRSNAVSAIPPSPDQIIADQKLANEQPGLSEQSSSLGHDLSSNPSPANVKVDPAICNSQYRPNVPGFSSKAKREDDFCRTGKPKCKEHWLSLCCYGSPLADEGGLTAGCVVCMRFPFLSCFNFQTITMSSFETLLGMDKMKRNRRERSIQRFWVNHLVDVLSFRVLSMGAM